MKRPSISIWGCCAIFCWALLTAFSRSLLEFLGMFTSGGAIYIAGGIVYLFITPPRKCRFSWRYHGLCGLLVVAYLTFFTIALGMAQDRIQSVEMGLINYLWPLLTFLFSIIFFKKQFSPFMVLSGIILSIWGFALSTAVLSGIPLAPAALWENFCDNPFPYLLMTLAAMSWALYSNILGTIPKDIPIDAMPYFMLAGGAILFGLGFCFHENSHWNLTVAWQLACMALLPVGAGYYCWDRAMLTSKRDSAIALSYLTPLLSAISTAVFFRLALPVTFYGACILVIAGAILCKKGIKPDSVK